MVYKPKFVRESAAYGLMSPEEAEFRASEKKRQEELEEKKRQEYFDALAKKERENEFIYSDNNVAPEYDENEYAYPYAEFDGNNFRVVDKDGIVGEWNAQSGYNDYQRVEATDVPNRGPIPEGQYTLYYNQLEQYDDKRRRTEKDADWMNNTASWGFERIPITPDEETDTHGRGGFFVHGGRELKSGGCIDLGLQMPQFGGVMKKYQQNLPLTVKYKDNFEKIKKK